MAEDSGSGSDEGLSLTLLLSWFTDAASLLRTAAPPPTSLVLAPVAPARTRSADAHAPAVTSGLAGKTPSLPDSLKELKQVVQSGEIRDLAPFSAELYRGFFDVFLRSLVFRPVCTPAGRRVRRTADDLSACALCFVCVCD